MARYYLITRAKGTFVYRRPDKAGGGWTSTKHEARFWDKEYKAIRLMHQLDTFQLIRQSRLQRGNMEVVDEAGLKLILEEMDRREIQKALMR